MTFIRRFFRYLCTEIWMPVFVMSLSLLTAAAFGHLWEHDFANYHYYNPWAFLNNRLETDILPNGIHGFFNPIIDLPFYYIVTYLNDFPAIGYALQGLWTAIYLYTACCIARFIFSQYSPSISNSTLFLFICLAFTREITYSQIGTPTNDHAASYFSILGLYWLLNLLHHRTFRAWPIIISGIMFGLAFGLKSTAVTWCLAGGATIILHYRLFPSFVKTLILFITGGLIGYLLINGWFMYQYYEIYSNPVFPFMNAVFGSPYYDRVNYIERGFCPNGLEYLYFPYLWLFNPHVNEYDYTDLTIVITYTLSLFSFFSLLFGKGRDFWKKNPLVLFLITFWFTGYIFWMTSFSVLRYFIIGETMGTAIILFFALKLYFLISNKIQTTFLQNYFAPQATYIVLCLMLGSITLYPKIKSIPEKIDTSAQQMLNTNTELNKIVLNHGSLVEIYNKDISYIIPILAQKSNFTVVGFPQNFWKKTGYDYGNEMKNFPLFEQQSARLRQSYGSNIYKFFNLKSYSQDDTALNYNILFNRLQTDDYCTSITTPLKHQDIVFCQPSPHRHASLTADKNGMTLAQTPLHRQFFNFAQSLTDCAYMNKCR